MARLKKAYASVPIGNPLEKGTLKCGIIVAPSRQGPAVQPGLSRP